MIHQLYAPTVDEIQKLICQLLKEAVEYYKGAFMMVSDGTVVSRIDGVYTSIDTVTVVGIDANINKAVLVKFDKMTVVEQWGCACIGEDGGKMLACITPPYGALDKVQPLLKAVEQLKVLVDNYETFSDVLIRVDKIHGTVEMDYEAFKSWKEM